MYRDVHQYRRGTHTISPSLMNIGCSNDDCLTTTSLNHNHPSFNSDNSATSTSMLHSQHAAPVTRYLMRPLTYNLNSLRLRHFRQRRQLLTLAIETSCDDTCVAILESGSHSAQEHRSKSLDPVRHHDHDHDDVSRSVVPQGQARLYFDEKITAQNSGRGGIHPLEALESHRSNLAKLVDRALTSLPLASDSRDHGRHVACRDGSLRWKPDFISATRGPGMRSNLTCGLEMAKGLAVAWQIPLVGVHHMQAHALTPRFVHAMQESESVSERQPELPFLTLLVSGGHTILLYSTGLTEHKVLASTVDIAIGDALDKCGRLLLSEETKANASDTAFGRCLSQYAFPDAASFNSWPVAKRRGDELDKPANEFGWQMQTPLSNTRDLVFSFASIQSRVESIARQRENVLQGPLPSQERLVLARTAIGTAFEHLSSRTVIALEDLMSQGVEIKQLIVSGGVAANDFLRHYLRLMLDARGFKNIRLVFPPVKYCTDNAAMIAWAGIEMYEAGFSSDLGIESLRKWTMDPDAEDGGILGVGGWCHETQAHKDSTSLLKSISRVDSRKAILHPHRMRKEKLSRVES